MRTAARKDSNHKSIVDGLRKYGASVLDVSQLKNCFDILVGYKGKTFIMEIKDGKKPPSQRRLTPGELEFMKTWKGSKYNVVLSLDDAVKVVNND